jgi:hypothetical protein
MKWPPRTSGTRIGPDRAPPAIRPISSAAPDAQPKYRVPLAVAGVAVNAEQRRATPLDAQPRRLMKHHPLMPGPTPPLARYDTVIPSIGRWRVRAAHTVAADKEFGPHPALAGSVHPHSERCLVPGSQRWAALFAPGGYVLDLEGSRGLREPLLRRRPSRRCRPRPAATPKGRARAQHWSLALAAFGIVATTGTGCFFVVSKMNSMARPATILVLRDRRRGRRANRSVLRRPGQRGTGIGVGVLRPLPDAP